MFVEIISCVKVIRAQYTFYVIAFISGPLRNIILMFYVHVFHESDTLAALVFTVITLVLYVYVKENLIVEQPLDMFYNLFFDDGLSVCLSI